MADQAGVYDSTPNTLTFHVTPVNDAPVAHIAEHGALLGLLDVSVNPIIDFSSKQCIGVNDVDNNLVRTVAAYNGGPGNVARWDNSLNASADPLLYIASIPLNETRDFVHRVMANYWMYQIRLGQPTPSLDQIAAHEWPRYAQQDVAGR